MKFKNILITGGVHGDEPTGINVAGYFSKKIKYIDGLICNIRAIKAKKRFLETDLNRSFSGLQPVSYEEIKARKIEKVLDKYDLIIDIHNTKALGTTCAITVCPPNDLHLKLTKHFGFKRLLIMPPSGSLIAQKPENALSLEVAKNSVKDYPESLLIKKIKAIRRRILINPTSNSIELYEFVNKVQKATFDRLKMKKKDFSNFKKLNDLQKIKLGLGEGEYYPVFLKKKEDEEVTFTLIKKIDVK